MLVAVLARIVPLLSTEKLVPLITLVPVEAPRVSVPVPFALTVNPVSTVEGEMIGFAPEKVRAVEVKVLVFIVLSTVKAPFAWIVPSVEILAPVDP